MAQKTIPPHLLGMTSSELEEFCETLGQPRFRGRQIAAWLYLHNVSSTDEMSDLPAGFRSRLHDTSILYRSRIVDRSTSRDGASKFLLELEDGERIEAVLLPYEKRVSVCVSSQVGCSVGCVFCATAMGGLVRNLTAGEIVDEMLTLQRESLRRISHVVYMGMGEPLLNYDHVLKSIRVLNEEVGIAMRHFTISTVGITPQIERLAAENLQITLAVSLHASNDSVRRTLMPTAAHYPLSGLIDACRDYAARTHRRVTFEYLLIHEVNDSLVHVRELASLLRGILCNVNLIPYNAVEGLGLKRPTPARVRAFRAILEDSGVTVTQRVERGHAISAACGQLRRRACS